MSTAKQSNNSSKIFQKLIDITKPNISPKTIEEFILNKELGSYLYFNKSLSLRRDSEPHYVSPHVPVVFDISNYMELLYRQPDGTLDVATDQFKKEFGVDGNAFLNICSFIPLYILPEMLSKAELANSAFISNAIYKIISNKYLFLKNLKQHTLKHLHRYYIELRDKACASAVILQKLQ